jgi:DNA adenine methylase
MKPPLTYYGGKQKMLKIILPLIPEHNQYIEPYAGGGAVFFAKEPVKTEILNDTNGEIINFYRVLQNDFEALKKEIDATLHSELQHRKAKAIYKNPDGYNSIQRAWAVWVLSTQSMYSNLSKQWNFGHIGKEAELIQRKKENFKDVFSKRIENTSIFCRDALYVIEKFDSPDTFHYIDPPYFNSDMGHYKGYEKKDFENLLQTLTAIKGKFMLSSYPSEMLTKYAHENGWGVNKYECAICAGLIKKRKKIEVLTINYDKLKDKQYAVRPAGIL